MEKLEYGIEPAQREKDVHISEVVDTVEEEIREARLRHLNFWGPPENQETSKDVEREFNRHISDYMSEFCPRCKCRMPCRCQIEEELNEDED